MSTTKSVPRTCHRCGLTKAARVANCKNCDKNFCNSCINKWLDFICLMLLYLHAYFGCILLHQEVMIKLRVAMFQLSGDENLVDCSLIIRRFGTLSFTFHAI